MSAPGPMVTSTRWLRSSAACATSATTVSASLRVSQAIDVERLLAGVEPRQPQQILDQPLHPLRVARDDLEEPAPRPRAGVAFGQRFDVAADRGQRRPQLVRHVGDEVAADLIGAPQLGDVVQHEHDAVRRGAGRRRGRRHDGARRIARRRQLHRVRARARTSAAATSSAIAGCRIVSTYCRPIGTRSSLSICCAARLTSCSRPCESTTITPSTMPARIASIRARSRACSASLRPTSCTDSSSARATVPSSSSPNPSRGGVRSPCR